MKKWTLWLGIIIILAAAGGGAYYYYYMRDDKATTETPLAVQARAIKGDIKTSISGTGSVEANSRETVTAGKSGTIATLSFKEGDKVKKGQVLATFEDNDNYDDQIESINKNITKTKDQIADKQEEYKQAIGTENEEQSTKSIKDEIDDLESTIDDYNDQLAKIYEDQAKEVKQVIAPIDGEVTTSDISVGDEVQANTTIAEIVDYTHLEFVTSIDELDIPNVKLKQTAQITLSAITDHSLEATVSEIAKEGTSSNGSASYSVSLLLNDIDGVMVGMSGQADIVTEQSADAVLVPVNAVVEFGGKSYVRVPGTGSGTGTGTGAAGSGTAPSGSTSGQQGQRNQGTQGATGNEAAAAGGWQGRGGTGGNGEGGGRFQGAGGGTTTAGGGQGTGRNIAAADGGSQSGTGTTPGGAASGGGTTPGGAAQGTTPGGTIPGGTGQGNASGGNFPGGNGASGGQGGRNGMANQMRESITLGGQLKEVTVGISNETYVEIKSGLAEGDTVLIPVATGTQGMGSSSTQQQTQQFGGFGGGGFGGNFPTGGFGGGGGGGNVRTSTRAATGGGGGAR
ncbi:efflux RND transporter periplasmic adaptor subunit [Paenibacillus sp. JDR-2]|uniref:efflux RND transporter periplasmic adaptor subunit n=1 Tax=Paenibacillus sp. (strain JDR-2) TaxID=324057 RepID=UPI0001AAF894|nr:efflux RND transporter periplasmic adaptor subunit [Paenibacillus sp. JDR-2]ACT04405.1 efflux transporter, RND family, MFP subunit [Paenibacillus sp. JDR-2]